MKSLAATVLFKTLRLASLILLTAIGTIALMRFAPGYFTDAREMDGQYADEARAELRTQQDREGSFSSEAKGFLVGWMHGDLGRSRHYDVPVVELVRPRAKATAKLLLCGIGCGWLLAFALALPFSARKGRSGEMLIAAPPAVLLAMPTGAMAMVCLLGGFGGPLVVLTVLIAARDFKFVYRLLRQTWTSPDLLYARAQGIRRSRVVGMYLLSTLRGEMLALAMMSLVFALSAVVPVEVIFDSPGLGQLAWAAAMNRDLPVLVSVMLMMAACIGIANLFNGNRAEVLECV